MNKSEIIAQACQFITENKFTSAEALIKENYPFIPIKKSPRQYTPRQMTSIFLRDGFIDRYKGEKLVYPPALRVLSNYLPETFPYHKNGRMDLGHMAYWELFPTIDHVIPVSRGGMDSEKNWVCCSMLTNSIKSNWTLEQLGWQLLDCGKISEWDGMISWFVGIVEKDTNLLNFPYIKTWFNAAKACIA